MLVTPYFNSHHSEFLDHNFLYSIYVFETLINSYFSFYCIKTTSLTWFTLFWLQNPQSGLLTILCFRRSPTFDHPGRYSVFTKTKILQKEASGFRKLIQNPNETNFLWSRKRIAYNFKTSLHNSQVTISLPYT